MREREKERDRQTDRDRDRDRETERERESVCARACECFFFPLFSICARKYVFVYARLLAATGVTDTVRLFMK